MKPPSAPRRRERWFALRAPRAPRLMRDGHCWRSGSRSLVVRRRVRRAGRDARPADRRRARTPSPSTTSAFRIRPLPGRRRRCQRRTIRERPVAGLAHAFVFWGFVAFGGYTVVEFLYGLGHRRSHGTPAGSTSTALVLTPFAVAVLGGIIYLLIRRAFVRPVALGTKVSIESIVIALFIATLMVTFLLDLAARRGVARRARELVGPRARHPGVPGADSRRRSTSTWCCRRSRCS